MILFYFIFWTFFKLFNNSFEEKKSHYDLKCVKYTLKRKFANVILLIVLLKMVHFNIFFSEKNKRKHILSYRVAIEAIHRSIRYASNEITLPILIQYADTSKSKI